MDHERLLDQLLHPHVRAEAGVGSWKIAWARRRNAF